MEGGTSAEWSRARLGVADGRVGAGCRNKVVRRRRLQKAPVKRRESVQPGAALVVRPGRIGRVVWGRGGGGQRDRQGR